MKRQRIFVVDDDPGILRLISANLNAREFEASTFNSAALALAGLSDAVPDLVLLDILMPGIDGMELLRRIRDMSGVPIMMISSKEEMEAKLEALALGADDYLTKPFNVDEMLARVRAVLRRSNGSSPQEAPKRYHYDSLDVDLENSEVVSSGKGVKFSAQEWSVLRVFVKYVGKVVTQRMLLQQAWGPEYGDEGDYVRTYVTRLRKKLEPEPGVPRYILTERGIGYRLVNPNRPLLGS